jgi:hypothetical protein
MSEVVYRGAVYRGMVTRVPRSLHRRVRLHCAEHGLKVKDFVTDAVDEKLHPKVRRLPRPKAPTVEKE